MKSHREAEVVASVAVREVVCEDCSRTFRRQSDCKLFWHWYTFLLMLYFLLLQVVQFLLLQVVQFLLLQVVQFLLLQVVQFLLLHVVQFLLLQVVQFLLLQVVQFLLLQVVQFLLLQVVQSISAASSRSISAASASLATAAGVGVGRSLWGRVGCTRRRSVVPGGGKRSISSTPWLTKSPRMASSSSSLKSIPWSSYGGDGGYGCSVAGGPRVTRGGGGGGGGGVGGRGIGGPSLSSQYCWYFGGYCRNSMQPPVYRLGDCCHTHTLRS